MRHAPFMESVRHSCVFMLVTGTCSTWLVLSTMCENPMCWTALELFFPPVGLIAGLSVAWKLILGVSSH